MVFDEKEDKDDGREKTRMRERMKEDAGALVTRIPFLRRRSERDEDEPPLLIDVMLVLSV